MISALVEGGPRRTSYASIEASVTQNFAIKLAATRYFSSPPCIGINGLGSAEDRHPAAPVNLNRLNPFLGETP